MFYTKISILHQKQKGFGGKEERKREKEKKEEKITERKENQQFSNLTKRRVAAVNGSALREVGVISYFG